MPVKNKVESHIFIINIIHIYLFTSLVRIVQQHILCLKLVHLISSSDIFKWAYCMLLASNREGNKKTFRRLRASGHEMFFSIQAYCMLLAWNREGNKKTFRRPSAPGHEMFFLIQAYCMLLACNREGKNKHFVARIFFTDGMWV